MLNKKEVLNVLDTFNITETEVIIAEKPKTFIKKNIKQKIKIIIKVIITSTKVAYIIKTLVIALIFHNLIIQQIDKNTIFVPNTAVYYTTLTNIILAQAKTLI